jgi:hypothetical protein
VQQYERHGFVMAADMREPGMILKTDWSFYGTAPRPTKPHW